MYTLVRYYTPTFGVPREMLGIYHTPRVWPATKYDPPQKIEKHIREIYRQFEKEQTCEETSFYITG